MPRPSFPLLFLIPLAPALRAQEPAADAPTTEAVVAAATLEARAAWGELVAAMAGSTPEAERAPITAFHLRAEALRREGVQTNETEFDYHYLAPDCIRFALPSGRETGRFGLRQNQYWVANQEGATPLVGKDYAEDRELVREMHTIARNFVALSDPAALRLTALARLLEPPSDVLALARGADRLTWLAIESPDFALFTDTAENAPEDRSFRVELGLMTAGDARGLPRYAVVRELQPAGAPKRPLAAPMFLRLDEFQGADGFHVPRVLFVHSWDPERRPAGFLESASQEVYVLEANLRPGYTVEDFRR